MTSLNGNYAFQKSLSGIVNISADTADISSLNIASAQIGDIKCNSINASGSITSNSITGTTLTGTLQTASQTNVTALGTLGSLMVTGSINQTDINEFATLQGTICRTMLVNNGTGRLDVSGNTFRFNGTGNAGFNGQGIYLSMQGGSIPTIWLASNTTNNRYIAFADASGGILASIQSWTRASPDLRFFTNGSTEALRLSGTASEANFYRTVTAPTINCSGTISSSSITSLWADGGGLGGSLNVSGSTFRFNANQEGGILGQGIYLRFISGSEPAVSLCASTPNSRRIVFANASGNQIAGIHSFAGTNASGDLRFFTSGNIERLRIHGNTQACQFYTPLTVSGIVNCLDGNGYYVNSVQVLSGTSLGSSIVSSSLRSLGVLTGLSCSGTAVLQTCNVSGTLTASNGVFGSCNVSGTWGAGVTASTTITYALGSGASLSTIDKRFGVSSFLGTANKQSFLLVKNIDSTLLTGSSWTVELWFNMTTALSGSILSLPEFNALNLSISTGTPNRLGLSIYNGTTLLVNTIFGTIATGAILINTWYHVAIVRTASSYLLFLNGVLLNTITSATNFLWGNLSSGLCLGASQSLDTVYTPPTFSPCRPFVGYIDEVRISNSSRYTASFTPQTTAFVTDANTVFLQHFDSTILESSQDAPATTPSSALRSDVSGNLTGISLQASRNITSSAGHIIAEQGDIVACTNFLSSTNRVVIAPRSLLQATYPFSGTSVFGAYTVHSDWSIAGTTHVIRTSDIFTGLSTASTFNYNWCAVINVFVSNKSTSGTIKAGVIRATVMCPSGVTNSIVQATEITKFNITTLLIEGVGTTVRVTTDSDCRIAYTFHAAI